MNDIIIDVVNEVINETINSNKSIGVYAGGFKPPTLGHFNVVLNALSKYPSLDKFIIYVGKKERNNITQEQSLIIWDIYKKYLPFKVEIIPSNIPVTDVYHLSKDNPNDKIYWFIGAREGKDEDFKDFASRTKASVYYPNIIPIQMVMKSDISGTQFRQGLKDNNIELVKKLLPGNLSKDEVQTIIDLLSSTINEVIKKQDNKWNVYSKDGKKLGSHTTKTNAEKQLQAIHINQHINEAEDKQFDDSLKMKDNKIINILSNNLKDIILHIKEKGGEVKKSFNLILSSIKENRKLTKEEIQYCYTQLKTVLKSIGLGAILVLPGSVIILGLIKVLKSSKYFNNNTLNEGYTNSETINCEEYINQLFEYYKELYPNIKEWSEVEYINNDEENSKDFFGRTAYYNPANYKITLFTHNRHPKDIARSYSHEMIHHIQNMEGRLNNYDTTNVNEDSHLEEIEKEAYEQGNIIFRKWENNINK